MKKVLIVLAVLAVLCVLVLVALPLGDRLFKQDREPAAETSSTNPPSTLPETSGNPQSAGPQQGFLYARITGVGGASYEGRLRWGGGEEAFWGDYFNGEKGKNPWLAYLPPERRTERRPFRIFGIELESSIRSHPGLRRERIAIPLA